ncbi:N-acetylglucosamine-6-phosphate deacetylase [Terriglobus sp. 2YAB30_2]|uniref:N-acetylglucosamine-6-phosphate deacetylase n=1 Tax=Terriglobus sp. 2YAB30_2 TaxID=3233023 RepID=UPI003F9926C7
MSGTPILGRDPGTGQCIRVLIEDGTIASIEECEQTTDLWISAGLIDLQVNGYAGFDVNGEDVIPNTVIDLVQAMLATGVTCFAPTIITAPEATILRNLRAIADARKRDSRSAACIPFIHVEGPHISPVDGYRGAHSREFVRPPSLAEFERWQAASGGLVGLVTLSPHFDRSDEYISALVSRGVHVAIGHTHASPEQIQNAVDAGARLSTHLGNGIPQQIARHPNPIWSQLADDRLSASFIADSHHLPAETLKAMVHAKGLERSLLVSDTVALAGMPPGIYTAPIGGRVELSPSGRLSMEGTTTLAGAAIPLVHCIGKAVRMTGRSLSEVLSMATANPGRFACGRGLLQEGVRADLICFRWTGEIAIHDVWLAGELVHQESA